MSHVADLNSLTLFARVVEAHSFSEAARRLKTPVSTISRRIAELEEQLGVRLLERTTRQLRLTDVGSEVLEHAQRGAELSEAVDNIVTNHHTELSGTLRLSAPPSISDSLLAPIVNRFQASHPQVRVQISITERTVDHIAEGIDLAFRVDPVEEQGSAARKLLTYRHQLVANPAYLMRHRAPRQPRDLLRHKLLAFSRGLPRYSWTFTRPTGTERETITFDPYLAMNDYAGLAAALLAGVGIGDLPPLVQPRHVAKGRLVEIMPNWRFRTFELTLVLLGRRFVPRPARVFADFAAEIAPKLFPSLPS